eukprot:Hpha_TRINITY_DN13793_c0_g1::TRINITY_DN13793_c0_g1_i5::g.142691::m.142691
MTRVQRSSSPSFQLSNFLPLPNAKRQKASGLAGSSSPSVHSPSNPAPLPEPRSTTGAGVLVGACVLLAGGAAVTIKLGDSGPTATCRSTTSATTSPPVSTTPRTVPPHIPGTAPPHFYITGGTIHTQ